jgi:hypothetical protein
MTGILVHLEAPEPLLVVSALVLHWGSWGPVASDWGCSHLTRELESQGLAQATPKKQV